MTHSARYRKMNRTVSTTVDSWIAEEELPVRANLKVAAIAEKENVDIRYYNVIYIFFCNSKKCTVRKNYFSNTFCYRMIE